MKRKRLWIGGAVLAALAIAVVAARRSPQPTAVQVTTVGREDVQAKVTEIGRAHV